MLFPNLTLLRFCVGLALFLSPLIVSAQEVCDNGIDDDGDGLVDLNDFEDCNCHLAADTPSLLPNPSLEEFSPAEPGCKSIQPGGLPDGTNQANCLVGWQRASLGTTDAWNAFTLAGSEPNYPAELPLPLPSGSGVAGFFVGIKDTDGIQFANSDGTLVPRYREYLATCFEDGKGMTKDVDYRLTFSLGFMEPVVFDNDGKRVLVESPSGVELSIYGIRKCSQLNFGYYHNCPEEAGAEGYELLTNVTVSGTADSWTEATVAFTAPNDYEAFAIGGSCGQEIKRADSKYYRNYYFIDNLILNQASAYGSPSAGPVQVDGADICADQIVLTGQDHPGATYQWYREGVAMQGQNGRSLTLTDATGKEGRYRLRVRWDAACAVTEEVIIQRPVIPEQFPDSVNLCGPGTQVSINASVMLGAAYRWSDGTEKSSVTISEPGTYSVTVTANCIERVETIEAVTRTETPYRYSLEPERPCLGDTVTIVVDSDWYTNGVMYMPSNGGFYFQDATDPIYVVAGEAASVTAMLFTPCGVATDIIEIPALRPFEAEAAVTDINCRGPEGRIEVSVTDGTPAAYRWSDSAQKSLHDNASQITVKRAGSYQLTVTGDDRCATSFEYQVVDRGFAVDLFPTDVSCGQDGAASVLARGGTPPYRYAWQSTTDAPPVTDGPTTLTDLDRGDYLVKISDSQGCATEAGFVIAGPERMEVAVRDSLLGCGDEQRGMISLDVSGGTAPYTYVIPGVAEQTAPAFTGLREGSYRVQVRDALNCETATETVVIDFPAPVGVDVGEDLLIDLGDTIVLQAEVTGVNPAAVTVEWTSGVARPVGDPDFFHLIATASPEASGTIRANVSTPDGCVYSDDLFVQVQNTINVYVPNAFSPNGDGVNDVLSVYSNVGVLGLEEFRVFDRWGGMVFESEAAEIDWDGTAQGNPLDPGAYIYRGVVRLRKGGTLPISGTVLLTR